MKIVADYKKFISPNEIDKIVNNLDIKKAPGIDQINNQLIKHVKPGHIKFLHFFLTYASILAFTFQLGKSRK